MFGIFSKKVAQDAKPQKSERSDKSLVDVFKASAYDSGIEVEDAKDAIRRVFQRGADSFEFYVPPTTAKGTGKSFAMDSNEMREAINKYNLTDSVFGKSGRMYNGLAENVREELLLHFSHFYFIGFPMCAQLAVHPFIHIACSIAGRDAIATGYELKFSEKHGDMDVDGDGKDDSIEYLSSMKCRLDELNMKNTCAELDYKKRVFGSGIAFPLIYKNGKDIDMSVPMNLDGLEGAKFKGWRVVDPIWLSPVFSPIDAFDPLSKMFYRPSWYRINNGRLIHHTWFYKVDGEEVADILKPTYYWCGVPLTQQIFERVWAFDKTANEAPLLCMSKRMLIVDANVQQMYKNRSYIYKLMSVIKKCWHNWGVFFKNESANVQMVDTNLAYLDETIFTQGQLVASIAGMPATKLLKTTPKGFNATGEYEWKEYAQNLTQIQDNEYTPFIVKTIDFINACHGVKKPVTVTWNPVDAPTEEQKAQVESTKANTRTSYVQNGILTVEEVREAMRTDESGEFTHITADNPELDRKAEMESIMRDIEADDDKDNAEEPQKEEEEK